MTHFARIALISLPLLIAACKNDKDGAADKATKPTEAKTAEPAKPEPPLDLTDSVDLGAAETDPDDKRFTGIKVKAPAGAKAEGGLTGIVVRIGERQAYEIAKAFEPGQFVPTTKAKANEDKLDKVVKFHIDTPEAILWETKSELGGDNNFHFAAEVKLGDQSFKCYNSGWGNFTKAQAEALLKSCQSVAK